MTVLVGDCRTVMPTHAPFDMIFADPPYGDTSLGWDRRVEGWLAIARQSLTPSGSLWLFGSLRSFLAIAAELRSAGFRYAQEIVWEKQNGSAFHADRFKRVHELIVQFYRSDARWDGIVARADEVRHPDYRRDVRPAVRLPPSRDFH